MSSSMVSSKDFNRIVKLSNELGKFTTYSAYRLAWEHDLSSKDFNVGERSGKKRDGYKTITKSDVRKKMEEYEYYSETDDDSDDSDDSEDDSDGTECSEDSSDDESEDE